MNITVIRRLIEILVSNKLRFILKIKNVSTQINSLVDNLLAAHID